MSKLKNSQNPALVKVYTDSQKNDWYTNQNPFDLSAIRGIAASRAERYVGMMLSEDTLKDLLEEHDRAAKQVDITKCFAIVQEIKNRQAFICEENSVLDLVNVYFFINDEDPARGDEKSTELKKKIWQEDSICKGFFLDVGFKLTNKLANIPEEDLKSYLAKTKHLADRVMDLISEKQGWS